MLRFAIWLLAAAMGTVGYAAEPSTVTPNDANAVQDFIYFTPDRPVFLRLRIYADGKPFRQVWKDHLQDLFGIADGNHDGSLTAEEVEHGQKSDNPFGSELDPLLQSPALWQADVDPPDGRICFVEFAAFVHQVQTGPFQAAGTSGNSSSAAENAVASNGASEAGAALFDVLDHSRDGLLTAKELQSARDAISTLDFDGDGTLSFEEMQHTRSPFAARAQPQGGSPGAVPIVALTGHVTTGLIERLLGEGDPRRGSKKDSLPVSRLRIPEDLKTRYDADRNSALDRDELRYLLQHPVPEVEIVLRVGSRDPGRHVVEIVKGPDDGAATVRVSDTGLVNIAVDDVQLEIGTSAWQPTAESLEENVVQLFRAFDRDGNGYLEKEEGGPASPFHKSFSLFDRDGNGQVYRDEVLSVMKGRIASGLSRTQMSAADRGQDLFEILDTNRDKRLSRSEIAAAAVRLSLWDRDGDSQLRLSEVPRLYQLTFSRGSPSVPGFAFPRPVSPSAGMPAADSGITPPKWFTKMDSNEDGTVSLREFLGTPEQFHEADRDHNEAIDPIEAASRR